MSRKIKNFVFALHNIVNNDDYLRYVTNDKITHGIIGEYQSPQNDKRNMSNDLRNVYFDMRKAMNAAYGKTSAE